MTGAHIIIGIGLVVGCLSLITAIYYFIKYRALNLQIQSIGDQIDQIVTQERTNRVLEFSDIEQVKRLTVQINRLLDTHQNIFVKYAQTQKSMKHMLSNVSHDLKTPLSVISGYVEMLSIDDSKSPEERKRILNKIDVKIREVLTLMDEFFKMNKLEAGDIELTQERVDICETVRLIALEHFETLTKNNFEVHMDIPSSPCFMLGSVEALNRIVGNLMSNAIRYGGEGQYLGVRVGLNASEKAIEVVVTDRGRGIPAAYHNQIFDRLFTLENSRNRDYQGSGLGLAITKQLTLQMGGSIRLESTMHVSTSFTVSFPQLLF
jgi:signal transduction histidine kinase